MKAINLDTYSLSLLTAKEDILNPRSSTNWALFAYDGATNNLKLSDSGAGGLVELAEKFHINRVLYGLCRVGTQGSGPPRIVMITWVGEGLEECRTMECAHHLPAIRAFFKVPDVFPKVTALLKEPKFLGAEAHVFISARRPEDVTEEKIRDIVSKINTPTERIRRSPLHVDKEETVGTNYRKTNAAMEMRRINRDSFWARAEKEEEERKEEERRRALEDRRRFEKERVLKERREEEERDRKMNEKLQMIEEQKRMQAKLQAEGRKQEKARWEQQQREHEEDMRARFRRSESIEKAAEAAVLVSQRSINPREFFRQLSTSSSSGTIPSPGSPRTVKPPFRRYQRSLTDTAFIFGRSDSSTPTSPRSPTVVSPFSRAPNSPFNRSLSPSSPSHRDPVFQPIYSPQCPADSPVSPHSPLQRSAPTSILPNLPPSKSISPRFPQQDPPAQASNAPSQAAPLPSPIPFPSPQPSAPPASPSLLASLSQPQPAPFSPPGPLDSAPALEAPPVPLPEVPAHTSMQSEGLFMATRMLSDLEPEADLTVQAVLVDTRIVPVAEDEDKEDEENEEEAMELKAPIALNAQVENPDVTLSLLRDQNAYAMTSLSPKPEPTDVNVQACSTVEGVATDRQPPAVSESEFEAVNVELRSVEEMVPVLNPVEKESLEETDFDPKEEEPAVELLMEFSKEDEQEREEIVQSDQVALASALPVEPVQVEQPEEEEGEEEEEELDVSCQSHQLHITAGEVIKAENQPSAQQKGNQPTNGFSDNEQDTKQNGLSKEHSGSERSLSPSELDQNCPLEPSHELELNPCVMRHDGLEKDLIKESSPDGTLCVRAIYDYQAEDESELSLEPGDIISDVETVDKAWWRGCSKDGRQGLFPANYVETI